MPWLASKYNLLYNCQLDSRIEMLIVCLGNGDDTQYFELPIRFISIDALLYFIKL